MPGITQIRLSGFGGQGVVLAGLLLGEAQASLKESMLRVKLVRCPGQGLPAASRRWSFPMPPSIFLT